MTLPQPTGQKSYMGKFANDAAALARIRAMKWDTTKDGLGQPEEGMTYTDTTLKIDKVYIDGTWKLQGVSTTINLADDAGIVIPTGKTGWGFAMIGDAEEYGRFTFKADGTVTLLESSANTVSTDTDTKFCIYDAGAGIAIKNRLGAAKDVSYDVKYM